MRFLLPWILTSALVGYFGRGRRFGFWGFFFFSVILSPFVGALALLAGAPSKASRERERAEVAAAVAPQGAPLHRTALAAGSRGRVVMTRPMRTGIAGLVVAWVVVGIVFAFVYLLGGAIAPGGIAATGGQTALIEALELSLEVGTLGRATTLPPSMTIAASIHRIIVLGLLVLMVSRLVAARYSAPLREANESVGRSLQRVDELEEELHTQQQAMADLQKRAAAQAAPATEPPVPA